MDTTAALKAACQAAAAEAARIDATSRDKLLKRARKHGLTKAEGTELIQA
jgi:hypothetical protein